MDSPFTLLPVLPELRFWVEVWISGDLGSLTFLRLIVSIWGSEAMLLRLWSVAVGPGLYKDLRVPQWHGVKKPLTHVIAPRAYLQAWLEWLLPPTWVWNPS